MDVLKPFDPWKSKLCTCRRKYSFNPYTGCAHGCLYCYATYIPRFYELRKKERVVSRLEKDLKKADLKIPISMSNSSDPYPPIERHEKITRNCIKLMKDYSVKLLVVTKSDLVVRDIDLLSEMSCCVSITVTGFKYAKLLEPNAPSPEKRIKALKELKSSGIPVILRLDPVLPLLTEGEVEEVIYKCDFVDHIVTSTLKLRFDSFNRISKAFSEVFPELNNIYKNLYFKRGEKMGNSYYLPKNLRIEILKKVEKACNEFGISCAFCREGISFKAKSCDGQHLLVY